MLCLQIFDPRRVQVANGFAQELRPWGSCHVRKAVAPSVPAALFFTAFVVALCPLGSKSLFAMDATPADVRTLPKGHECPLWQIYSIIMETYLRSNMFYLVMERKVFNFEMEYGCKKISFVSSFTLHFILCIYYLSFILWIEWRIDIHSTLSR